MTKKTMVVLSGGKGALRRNDLVHQTDMWRETWNARFLRREPWYRKTSRALLKRTVARAALGAALAAVIVAQLGAALLIAVGILRLSMR